MFYFVLKFIFSTWSFMLNRLLGCMNKRERRTIVVMLSDCSCCFSGKQLLVEAWNGKKQCSISPLVTGLHKYSYWRYLWVCISLHNFLLHLLKVFVLVYDTSNEDTFKYVKSMREQILEIKGSETLIVVVGNKQDVTDPRNAFLKSNMQHTAKKWKCPFVFCSAKYNWHITKVFQEILKTIETEIDSKKETAHRNHGRWANVQTCKISWLV